MKDQTRLSTLCVHAGELEDAHGAPHTPLYQTSTFRFKKTADLLDVIKGRKPGALYTRYGMNPSIVSVERKLAALEAAEEALAFASGMAALAGLFLAHGRAGIACFGEAYGGTLEILTDLLPGLGIAAHFLEGSDSAGLEKLLAQGVGLVFIETPTNPTLEIADIAAIAARAHRHGALLAVDNTFASPVNQNPLALGADLVMHSCTKYLGGHSDLTAGCVMGSAELLTPLRTWRRCLGSTIAAETAALLARSLRSLVVRVRAQNASAQAVAEAMAVHPRVARVLYPGLPDFPGHALAARQMSGFGGIVTIEVEGGGEAAVRVADSLRLFMLAASLGGVESLATQPCTTTHHALTPQERHSRGISDAMLRLSIGLEDPADLIADLEQALA